MLFVEIDASINPNTIIQEDCETLTPSQFLNHTRLITMVYPFWIYDKDWLRKKLDWEKNFKSNFLIDGGKSIFSISETIKVRHPNRTSRECRVSDIMLLQDLQPQDLWQNNLKTAKCKLSNCRPAMELWLVNLFSWSSFSKSTGVGRMWRNEA